jgi:hypothetical protein
MKKLDELRVLERKLRVCKAEVKQARERVFALRNDEEDLVIKLQILKAELKQ